MTIWQPGMRCVCVFDQDLPPWRGDEFHPDSTLDGLQKGQVYTVREVYRHWFDGVVCLVIAEIKRADKLEPGFDASRFRPLSETRLDQFRQHLAPAPRRAVREEA